MTFRHKQFRVWVLLWGLLTGVDFTSSALSRDGEVSLFGVSGEAVAYIDFNDKATIYTWDGEPVAYIEPDRHMSVYGFNGKHLGWIRDDFIIDHHGSIACADRSVMRSTMLEGLKSLKMLKPLKSLKELEPIQPVLLRSWAEFPCKLILMNGIN